jgi:hypothetical protein
VLRAPAQDLIAQIGRFDGTTWVTIPTEFGGLPDLFAANITELGDFAVLVTAPTPSRSAAASLGASRSPAPSGSDGSGGLPIWLIVALGVVAVGAGLAWGLLGDRDSR